MIALSLILCSRNDAYMGDSRYRLESTLNYTAAAVARCGLTHAVELVVCDWGSRTPLAEVVRLTPAAADLTRFIHVPPDLAEARQGRSPFPEVLALNAAARRARGAFIGRIDQDTLTGARFLETFTGWVTGARPVPEGVPQPLASTLFFANRRSIPYRLATRRPALPDLTRYLDARGGRLTIETGRVIYHLDVGIWLAHRDRWHACGGYDERMLFMNEMDPDMVRRLLTRHPLVDLGSLVGWDFYHLDHYHPRGSRSSSTHREVNSTHRFPDLGFNPSGPGWGLADAALPEAAATPRAVPAPETWWTRGRFAGTRARVAAECAIDRLRYPFVPRWRRRARLALAGLQGEPVRRWPAILRALWASRATAAPHDEG